MTELTTARFARQRAGAIRQGMRDYLKTLALIKEAWDQRDWEALGYSDWQSYVDGEFGAARLGLPSDQRQKAVVELRMAGMSTRAIGSALGISHTEVGRQLRSGGTDVPPEAEIQGTDGKTYAAARPQSPGPLPEPSPDDDLAAGRSVKFDSPEEMDAALDAVIDNPQSRAGEAHAGPSTQVSDPRPAPEANRVFRGTPEAGDAGPAEDFPPPPARPDPLDDPEHIERQHREGSSDAVAEALVAVKMRLEPDPVRWLTETWIPGRYRFRDMPRVRDCFTPDGLRTSAKYLEILADHLDATGGTL